LLSCEWQIGYELEMLPVAAVFWLTWWGKQATRDQRKLEVVEQRAVIEKMAALRAQAIP
jgi:hypothetical protein